MAKIYLINVGANLAHRGQARSPVFNDGTFVYVSFPDDGCKGRYTSEAAPFVRDPKRMRTHIDPDWKNLTYGDCCANPRARALLSVRPDNILLFWALLWRIRDRNDDVWASDQKGWYLIGALRVHHILSSRGGISHLPQTDQRRVVQNEHMNGKRVESRDFVRIFIGKPQHSARFKHAVDLGIYRNNGLLKRAILTAKGQRVMWDRSPRWNSVTRACRAVLDLSVSDDFRRAELIRRAVQNANPKLDLLADLK
jgi:hypothetical protein